MSALEATLGGYLVLYDNSIETNLPRRHFNEFYARAKGASAIITSYLRRHSKDISDFVLRYIRRGKPVKIIGQGVLDYGKEVLAATDYTKDTEENGSANLEEAVILLSKYYEQPRSVAPFTIKRSISTRYLLDHEYMHAEARERTEAGVERNLYNYYKSRYESTTGQEKLDYKTLMMIALYRMNYHAPRIDKENAKNAERDKKSSEDKKSDESEGDEPENGGADPPDEADHEENHEGDCEGDSEE
ncbi:hypothetical protein JW968_03205 [Candidatus Woesearchaeota archaeon]|nr:hypothetical protein [Candidatus Woesearchaeota archaeon]